MVIIYKSSRQGDKLITLLGLFIIAGQSNKCSKGLHLIQIQKHRAQHAGINGGPYQAMFDQKAKTGLNSLPKDFQQKKSQNLQ